MVATIIVKRYPFFVSLFPTREEAEKEISEHTTKDLELVAVEHHDDNKIVDLGYGIVYTNTNKLLNITDIK